MDKIKSDSSEVPAENHPPLDFSYNQEDHIVVCSICKNKVMKWFCRFRVPVLTCDEGEIMNHKELEIICSGCQGSH